MWRSSVRHAGFGKDHECMGKKIICMLLCLIVCLSVGYAEESPSFKRYQDALQWVQENRPMHLDLGETSLKISQIADLKAAMPEGGSVSFSLNWCKTTVTDQDTEVDLNGSLLSVSEKDIRSLLALCPQLKKLTVSKHRELSNKIMMPLVDENPDIEFVWLIRIGGYTLVSNQTAYSTMKKRTEGYRLRSSELEPLRYAKNLRALDLGHHDITDISVIGELTELRILILGDNKIEDLSPLANLTHLQYAELFTNRIKDISPLAGCTELLDLNLTVNQITDITPLMGCMQLERVWASHNKFEESGVEAFRETHPNCILDLTNAHPTADDWRHHPRYDQYLAMFKSKTWKPFE